MLKGSSANNIQEAGKIRQDGQEPMKWARLMDASQCLAEKLRPNRYKFAEFLEGITRIRSIIARP